MIASSPAFTDAELAAFNDPIHRFWAAIVDLRDLGAEHHALTARLAVLEGQLADAARGTPEQRERAQERRERWKGHLDHLEADAHSGRLLLASLWHRLPTAERRAIRARFGVEASMPAPMLAAWAWSRAKAGEAMPGLAPW